MRKPTMRKLTWPQAIAWRLRRQHLDRRLPRARLLPLTSELCGLHAQVMSSAELTALARIENLRPNDISGALWEDRTLMKTWAMRSTLHLLPASEYSRWLGAFRIYERARSDAWYAFFNVTADELEQLTEACAVATRGRMLTRAQLADELVRMTGLANVHEKLRLGWGSLLKPACYRGYLCFGPNVGQNTQFTHPEIAPDEEASDEFVTRSFYKTYGPATLAEFAHWLGAPRSHVRRMFAALGEELEEIDLEGAPSWILRKDYRAASQCDPVKTVRLLPAFDQYVFAAGPQSARFLPGDFHKLIYKNQGWFAPVLLVDGLMAGVWKFIRRGGALLIEIQPFKTMAARVRRGAEEEAERIARYMDRKLDLRWREQ